MTTMLRPRWQIEVSEGVARVTFSPAEANERVAESVRTWYGRDGETFTREPITLALNGDDLSDLVADLHMARERADDQAVTGEG